MKSAEQKLRAIEQISRYREEKIKREFVKLEEELRREEERIKMDREKEERRRVHQESIKKRLDEFRKVKDEKIKEDGIRQVEIRKSLKLQQLEMIKYKEHMVNLVRVRSIEAKDTRVQVAETPVNLTESRRLAE